MSNSINGIKGNYSVQIGSINQGPKSQTDVPQNNNLKRAQVSDISPALNDYGVKVPIPYSKMGEANLPYGLKAYFYKLSNGQRVVILPKEGETVLKTYVNTGSMNENDNIRGISHYIEHNLFNGSEGLEAGEFFRTTDQMGANTNASTGLAETNYFISSHLLNDGDLEKKIKIHASMLETPRFASEMLEKEKGIVNSEINMITSNPENIAYNKTLKALFNINTSSNDVIAGTTDNITNLTREDVVNYFNRNYYPANMVTIVSGEVEPESVMKLLSKYFSSNKKIPSGRYFEQLNPITHTARQDIISDKTKTPYITMGFVGPANNDTKGRIYSEALSRLMFESSEAEYAFKSLNAGVECVGEKILPKPDAPRALMIMADVSEDNVEKMLKLIYKQIQKRQNKPITEDELKIIKRELKKDFTKMFESSFAINNFIGAAMLEDNISSLNEYEKIIDEMSPEDLQKAAKEYFNLNKTAITVLHPGQVNEKSIIDNYNKAKDLTFTGALKKQAVRLENVKQYNLQNNFRVVLNESPYPLSVMEINFETSKPVKTSNPAAYYVLNMILSEEGSMNKTIDEILRKLEEDGIDAGVSSGVHGIYSYFAFESNDIDKAVASVKEIIQNPRFTQGAFDEAVKNLKDNLLRAEKSPWQKLSPELFKGINFTEDEILEGVKTLTLSDVKKLYSDIMDNSQGRVVISAPFKENPELRNKVFAGISSFNSVKPYNYEINDNYTPQTETKILKEIDNKSQAKIVMAYKFKDNGNLKDNAAVELLNTIIGGGPSSRLFNDLREKQKLAYSVRSVLRNEGNTSVLGLTIGTTTDNKETGEKSFDNLQKSINGFKDHVEKIKKDGVTEQELNSAKLAIKNAILSANERTSGKNDTLMAGLDTYYGISRENQYLDLIDQITVSDIYNAAQNVFAGKPVYSIVATADTFNYNKEYLDNLV